jgi:hypothetical protein
MAKAQDLQLENKGQDPPFSKPEGSGLVKQLSKKKYKFYKNNIWASLTLTITL